MFSVHRPVSLFKGGSICEEKIFRYSFRTEVQPGNHRLADLWPFASKNNTHLLTFEFRTSLGTSVFAPSYRSCFKYGVRSLNIQRFNSHCSSKYVLFMGQSDLDPRTIDLNLNVNLPIEILYQYKYVEQAERLNYGTTTACLRKGSAYRCKITKEHEQGFNGNNVAWSLVYFQKECIVHRQYKIYSIHWESSSTSEVTKMKELFTICLHVNLVILPHLMDGLSMPLSFAGNPKFVNKLPLYTFNSQFMYNNLNFSFLLWNKLHVYFVTFLLSISIYLQYH